MSGTREPLRILELRSALGAGGGPEKTILHGTAAADPARHRITVCYLRDARDREFSIGERFREHVRYVEIVERRSLDPRIWAELRALVRRERFHVVHAHEYKTDLLAYLLSWTDALVPLATAHGWVGRSPRERAYYAADRRLLARFPAVIAVSSDVRDALVRAGARPDRVHHVPNGIDPVAFRRNRAREHEARRRFGLVEGEIAIGAIGRIAPEKGLDRLIDAVAALGASRPGLRLLVAGSGELRGELARRAARRGIADGVRFLGRVDDVVELHHALDVYVQASLHEGTANALLEAMALETPIVATDAGGTADLVRGGEHALVVSRGDARALAAGIERVLADPEAAARRARAARERVERELSFAARMRAVEAVYDRLGAGIAAR